MTHRPPAPGAPVGPHTSAVTAVVLAAGAGTRLGELGRRYSKPMVPVAGRPLIDWVIARLRQAGVGRVVVVGYPSDAALSAYLRNTHPHIALSMQPQRLGIADALYQALPLVADQAAYLACACDSLFAVADVARLIAVGRAHPAAAVVAVLDMGAAATASRSAVRLDGERVVQIVEKPPAGTLPSGAVAMPLYWLPQSFAPQLADVQALDGERYVSTALNSFLAAGGDVRAVIIQQRIEVTTANDVERAAAQLLEAGRAVEPPHNFERLTSVTRQIPRLELSDLPVELADALRPRVERLGYLGEFFKCTAHQPEALLSFMSFTEDLKQALPDDLHEIVALSVSTILDNRYERHQHERLCRRLGFTDEWIRAVTALRPDVANALRDDQRAVQQLVVATLARQGHGVQPELEATIVALGPAQSVAVLLATGRYLTHSLITNALGLEPPVPSIFETESSK